MGGVPPYGYRVENRKLLIDDERAAHVRWVFDRFIEIGSGTELAREVAKRGVSAPRGNRIDKKYLYRMLNNHAYIGEAVHTRAVVHSVMAHLPVSNYSGAAASSIKKEKIRRWAMRETRPQQQEFRRKIAERDGLRCAISGCEIAEVLDAAHLLPRADGGSDAPQNGIILRADLHRLFDAGLLELDCGGLTAISEAIADQDYLRFHEVIAQSGADFGLGR